jgi:hypothetical protein
MRITAMVALVLQWPHQYANSGLLATQHDMLLWMYRRVTPYDRGCQLLQPGDAA